MTDLEKGGASRTRCVLSCRTRHRPYCQASVFEKSEPSQETWMLFFFETLSTIPVPGVAANPVVAVDGPSRQIIGQTSNQFRPCSFIHSDDCVGPHIPGS
jgi:hypothetical protein